MGKLTQKIVYLSIISLVLLNFNMQSNIASAEACEVYLGGIPLGLEIQTQIVEVVGLCDVMTVDGSNCPAVQSGIKVGDIIKTINGKEIMSSQSVYDCITDDLVKINVSVERDGEELNMDVKPVQDIISKKMKIGVLIKDSLNGIGTMTFATTNGDFAALGHPITTKNGNIIPINGGNVCSSSIYQVKRGQRGFPGELKGTIENSEIIGFIEKNSEDGVYGKITSEIKNNLDLIKIAKLNEAKPGEAKILTTIKGSKAEWFDINLVKVEDYNRFNRNFVIKVTDNRLLDITGGIVQGMSGSPIVQNGKLIGAITHVFINDPTRGYGIGIEKMLSSY